MSQPLYILFLKYNISQILRSCQSLDFLRKENIPFDLVENGGEILLSSGQLIRGQNGTSLLYWILRWYKTLFSIVVLHSYIFQFCNFLVVCKLDDLILPFKDLVKMSALLLYQVWVFYSWEDFDKSMMVVSDEQRLWFSSTSFESVSPTVNQFKRRIRHQPMIKKL